LAKVICARENGELMSDDKPTEHQIQLLRELSAAGGILIVRRASEFPNYTRLEALGYVTSQSADFGDVRFRITRKGAELLGRN
jgi:DNA-binding PadR family transcriptional regulator